MKIIKQKFITREYAHQNLNYLFIYGENLEKTEPCGGQAKELRYCENSFGITTKRKAAHGSNDCYFWDDEADAWEFVKIDFDILEVLMRRFQAVVIPEDGIGTGLAKLPETAPKLLEHINKRLADLEKI